MSKYSFELKKKVVDDYNNNKGGFRYLAKKYGIPDKKIIYQWVKTFNVIGSEGLMLKKKNHTYSFQKKLAIVELYLSSELSYQDIALKEGISNPSMICVWVNRFRAAGPEGLRAHKKGRKSTLSKVIKDTSISSNENHIINTSVEHVRELEEELLKLRIENAFLKELRRLRLEDEAKMREWRESSAASEEISN